MAAILIKVNLKKYKFALISETVRVRAKPTKFGITFVVNDHSITFLNIWKILRKFWKI